MSVFTALVFVARLSESRFSPCSISIRFVTAKYGGWSLTFFSRMTGSSLPLWVVLFLWFLWFIGDGLEQAWGAFGLRFISCRNDRHDHRRIFLWSEFFQFMLIASLFFAFARFYPDHVIYLFFILPVKMKWIAWVSAAFLLVRLRCRHEFLSHGAGGAMANYLIFFGPKSSTTPVIVAMSRRGASVMNADARSEAEPLHCAICGATEVSDPNLEFRVARDGEEYCMPHLPKAATPARRCSRHPRSRGVPSRNLSSSGSGDSLRRRASNTALDQISWRRKLAR